MAWFPIFAKFLESAEYKSLTPREKIYFWYLISRFNKDGNFYQSDLEIAIILSCSMETIRRARRKLIRMGLIEVKPGTLTKRKHCLSTRYLNVRYATMEEDGFFAQIPRYTFEVMLDNLRKSRLQPADVVNYVILSYWFWRNQGKYEDRDRFFITKKELQSLTNLPDATKRVVRIYETITFSGGGHLFEFEEQHHRFIFKNWSIFTDPNKNENNRLNAERRLKEIKDLVANEKRKRQIKAQQKMVAMMPKKSKRSVPSRDPVSVFEELYAVEFGRRPNLKGAERIHALEQIFGRNSICQAIRWYFAADTVPNSSGAKTRTLGNFVCNFEEILRLSAQSTFV